jgi:hypothetical protein
MADALQYIMRPFSISHRICQNFLLNFQHARQWKNLNIENVKGAGPRGKQISAMD